MIKNIYLFVFGLIFLVVSVNCVFGFDYVLGTDVIDKPDLAKPAKGETIIDPNFHTKITRISDKTTDGYIDGGITPTYSMINSVNADGTYLLLRGTGANWYLYDTKTFEMIKELSFLQGETSPYWDSSDPDILYWHKSRYSQFRTSGPKFLSYRISSDETTLLHDFTEDFPAYFKGNNSVPCGSGCYGHYIFKEDYNEPSLDCRYWPFWIKEMQAGGSIVIKAGFIYDKQTDSIIGVLYPPDLAAANKGSFSVSPYGNYVVARDQISGGSYWDITLSNKITSSINGGHSDWAIDTEGNEVRVWQDTTYDHYAMFDVKTGVRYGLQSACAGSGDYCGSYCPGIHLSGNNYNTPGWAVISTYNANCLWSDNQLFMLELDPNKARWKVEPGKSKEYLSPAENATIWRLAHSQSVGSYYWAQPHATIDHDGKFVYWGSNWNVDGSPVETYVVALPETWWEDLSGPLQSCSGLDGDCCSSGQTCNGGAFQLSSDCGSLCCVDGVCQSPQTETWSKNFIASYDFDDSDAQTIAEKYDVIVTSTNEASAVSSIEDIDPSIMTLFYDNALTHGNEHYVRDPAYPGLKLIDDDWDWALHDLSDPDYRASLASAIANTISSYPQFDGVFLDDIPYNIVPSRFHIEGYDDDIDPTLPSDLVENWKSYMTSLLQEVKSAIGTKLLISNGGFYETLYSDEVDGLMHEAFAHANWQDTSTYPSTDTWIDNIEIYGVPLLDSNKYVLFQSGVFDGASQSEIEQLVRYTYTSFLMMTDEDNHGKHYFAPSIYYNSFYWYDDWEHDLGAALDDCSNVYPDCQVPGESFVFRREFENAWIYVNPTDSSSGSIDLGGTYYTPEGNEMTSLTLEAREGEILLRDNPIISTCTSGADTDDSGSVSMDELVAFIGSWKTGSITIAQVLEAIGEWKSGCQE